jgi:uncharacterized GH25 family protein
MFVSSRLVRFFCLFVLLQGSFSLAHAQPLPERRTLAGRVVGTDGKPIPGISITLRRENDMGGYSFWGALTVTDAQGNFSFPDAEEDSYYISAEDEAKRYAPLQDQRFVLDANSKTWKVTLQRLADVTFRFLKTDGTPLTSSRVSVRLDRDDFSGQPLRRITDGKGEVKFNEQRPAKYRIQVVAPGVGYAILNDVNIQYSATPQPIDVRLQSGGNLRLTALESKNQNDAGRALGGAMLTLGQSTQASPEDRAAGRLARPENMNLQMLYTWSGEGGAVTRDGDGILEISDLPPGRYSARLLAPGYAPSAWQEVEVKTGENTNLDFRFAPRRPQASLDVVLTSNNAQALASSEWNLQLRLLSSEPENAGAAPALPGAEPMEELAMNPIPGMLFRRVRADANGKFTLYPLPPGKWRLVLTAPREPGKEGRGAVFQKDVDVTTAGSSVSIPVTLPKP